MDTITEIIDVVRDAIEAGLIKSETVESYSDTVANLSGPALEDYLQNLWDNL